MRIPTNARELDHELARRAGTRDLILHFDIPAGILESRPTYDARVADMLETAKDELRRETGAVTYALPALETIILRVNASDALLATRHAATRKWGKGRCLAATGVARHVYLPGTLTGRVPRPTYRTMQAKDSLPNLALIQAYDAQRVTTGDGAHIGIIDTGVDYDHPELGSRFTDEKGYDFIEDHERPRDQNGHGTHVAGTVAGRTTGVAPGCTLYALRVLDADGYGSEAGVLRALDWAIRHELDAVNLSLGSAYPSEFEEDAFTRAIEAGVAIIAAAGNESYGPSYPACYPGAVSVAAVDNDCRHADFSNIWTETDISAPGVNVFSCYLGGGYAELSGTSMATPHVCGVVALATSVRKRSPDALEQLLETNCRELGKNDPQQHEKYGAGLIQAADTIRDAARLTKVMRWLRPA